LEFRSRDSDMTVKSVKAGGSSIVVSVSIAMALAGSTWGQSKISTILGGAPNDLPGPSANLNTPSAVACDNNGNVYVVLRGAGEVVRIDSQGIVWLFAGGGSGLDGGPAVSAGLGGPAAVAVDSTGAVYIADGNRVRRVGSNGIITAFAGTGTAGYGGDGGPALNAQLNSPSGIAFDTSGNLYVADSGNNVIREVTTDGNIKTFAGTGTRTYGGDDGPPLQASFNAPAGVAVDGAGNVYIADNGNNLIREVMVSSGLIQRIAGVTTTTGGNSNKAIDASLYGPTSLALDSAGNLYLVEPNRYWVREIVGPSGGTGVISIYAGSGDQGFTGDGGVANGAELNALGVALNSQNDLFIADGINNRVREVTPGNEVINTVAGNGLATYNPRGLAVRGNILYFSDSANNVVRSFNLNTGQLEVVAGTGVAGSAGDTGPAISATLKTPIGLAVDNAGDLFIADSANNRVREITATGSFLGIATSGLTSTTGGSIVPGDIDTVAGSNNLLSSGSSIGDGGAATSAILQQPYAVAVDQSGNLYIAEREGQRIREVNTAGVINTVAGTGASGVPPSPSGPALSQPLNFPQGLAIEPSGSLLIADTSNNMIRRYSNATLTTVAGTTAGYAGDGGPATSAMLQSPEGVAEDSNGNIYISDSSNEVIRWVGSDGIINTIAGMAGHAGYNGDGSPATSYELSTPFAVAALSGCTLAVADSQNQRLRQVWPAVTYTINSNYPSTALQVMVDGQPVTTPYTIGWLPGSQHVVSAPSLQTIGGLETQTQYQYTGSGSQTINVGCGPAFGPPVTLNFQAQYELTIVSDDGGSASSAAQWQSPGATVTVTATANAGYVFTGWEGACKGQGACQIVMNGPESVKADFAPAQALSGSIRTAAGVIGAGLSVPPVAALSPNGIMSIFGSNFAPAGTAGQTLLVNGQVSTELDGVCVMVNSIAAPLFYVGPAQINFQVPSQVAGSQSAPVQVVTGCDTASPVQSNAVTLPVQTVAPEFLYWIQNTNGQDPIAGTDYNSGECLGAPGLLPSCVFQSFAPAKPGDILTLYAVGFGATSPSFASGTPATAAAQVPGSVQVSIGSTNLPQSDIQYVGVTPGYTGLYQVNVQVPASIPSGNQQVLITINGVSSPSGAYITVGQ
jgi:uncharacterized protein (TIGR03437 family)